MLAILAAVMLAAAPEQDTVFLREGGRLVGAVTEESGQAVVVRLLDGSIRRLERRDVVRIEYRDGTVSVPPAEPSPAAAPAEPAPSPPAGAAGAGPPPQYPPDYRPPEALTPRPGPGDEVAPGAAPEPAQAAPPGARPAPSAWGALGLGGTFFGGELEPGVRVGRIFTPQVNLQLEGGLAVTPRLGVALYLDVGIGGAGSDVRTYCRANGLSCSGETLRIGAMLRDTFSAGPRTVPWVGLGTGFAYGHVSTAATSGSDAQQVLQYWGWEMLRVQGGVDWRRWDTVAVGLYAGVSYVLYTRYEDAGGQIALPRSSTHPVAEAGVRLVFFPQE